MNNGQTFNMSSEEFAADPYRNSEIRNPESHEYVDLSKFGLSAAPSINDPQYAQINLSISQNFGQFFFNANDPAVAKTNVPIKEESSMHFAVIAATCIFIGGIIGGIILFGIPQTIASNYKTGGGILIGATYLTYLAVSTCCSQIRGYITNLKKFDNYKETYDKMCAGRGYFHFWIECYHYRTVRTKKGTRRQKVVTHTASENYFPRESLDESGNITGITDIKTYVFINYLKKFYFTNQASSSAFYAAYQSFVSRNNRDLHQNHTQTFQIEGFEPEVGFCMLGQSAHNSIIFYVFTLLGLALPYSCILQRSVSRYSINILKRLTC